MDLRIRLVASLGAVMALLLVVASGVLVLDVRRDVVEEVRASRQLADVLIQAGRLGSEGSPEARQSLDGALEQGALRHIRLQWDPETPGGPGLAVTPHWLIPDEAYALAPVRLAVGEQTLVIRPDPQAELQEALADSLGIFAALAVFAATTLALAWWLVHRALSPVRALLEGLSRLEQGAVQPDLPTFHLQEFARIAEGINQLAASLAQSRAGQQYLTHRLLALQESERHELARELHDEFGQMLTAMSVTASYIERNLGKAPEKQIRESAWGLGQEARAMSIQVRTLLSRLRPHGLEGVGLLQGLQDLLEGWRQRAPELSLEAELPETLQALDQQSGLALYRLLQEALTNVLRHSGASHCHVVLKQDSGGLSLSVQDNGRGRVEDIAHSLGSGLLGMRERMGMVGGRFRLQNLAPKGLGLMAWIPFQGATP